MGREPGGGGDHVVALERVTCRQRQRSAPAGCTGKYLGGKGTWVAAGQRARSREAEPARRTGGEAKQDWRYALEGGTRATPCKMGSCRCECPGDDQQSAGSGSGRTDYEVLEHEKKKAGRLS